ncbi:MAG: ExbD/TolR family protein [Gemmatimonadales bacterium]
MADPNMTPMIDVLLVLLVIFILAQQVLQRSIDVQLPVDKDDPGEPGLPPIVMEIMQDGSFLVNKQFVQRNQLQGFLDQVFSDRPDKLLFIKSGGPGVTYGDVVTAMDVAKGAGVEVLGAMLPTDEEWERMQAAGN